LIDIHCIDRKISHKKEIDSPIKIVLHMLKIVLN